MPADADPPEPQCVTSRQDEREARAVRLPRSTTKGWIIATAVAVGSLACYVLLVSALFFVPPLIEEWRHRQGFDARLWQKQGNSGHDSRWPPRLCIVDDLLASARLSGRTEDQVIELLGPPNDRLAAIGGEGREISYCLRPERGAFGIDSESLRIKFGPDNTLDRVWVHRD